ncbi:MAG: hypothetical protein C5B59_08280 [Bacteroidetes bacterium]|nr:MAG: hypothetical protein C5B59_08280 [Bacteroidota bacterium]
MEIQLQKSILKVLVYFDLFNYPVSEDEIYLFLDKKADREELLCQLRLLVLHEMVYKINEFYSLKPDPSLVKKRLDENNRAQVLLKTARRISRFLYLFPYVRAISISGSLSKNVADEKADIDYFIITQPNRLWIARSIMHFFKKLTFITGHQHWYCMNYYVDEEGLQIEEKNIFTATELVTLMPMRGNGAIQKLIEANEWTKEYFPNTTIKCASCDPPRSWVKGLGESLFNNSLGQRLENYLMGLTSKRWKKKEDNQKLNIKGNRMGLKTDKHFCKPSPVFFQKKLLESYQTRLHEWNLKWNVMISRAKASHGFFRREII